MGTKRAKTASGRVERHISVRAVRRSSPDLRKLSRALIALAMEQATAETTREQAPTKTSGGSDV